MNHLVAALFAQGVSIRPEFLYGRRRPRVIDWSAPESPRRTTVELKLGFPEMRLSEATIERLRAKPAIAGLPGGHSLESHLQAESEKGEFQPRAESLFPMEPRLPAEFGNGDRLKAELQLSSRPLPPREPLLPAEFGRGPTEGGTPTLEGFPE